MLHRKLFRLKGKELKGKLRSLRNMWTWKDIFSVILYETHKTKAKIIIPYCGFIIYLDAML